MRNGAEFLYDVLETLVRDHKRVATREEDVANLWSLSYILNALLDVVHRVLGVFLTSKTTACAVTAVHGAHIRDEKQDAVWIAVSKTRNRRVRVLVKWIEEVSLGAMQLLDCRDALLADRVVRVVLVDEGEVVWSDGHTEGLEGLANAVLFLLSQFYVFFQLVQSLNAVTNLPVPVVPFCIRDVWKHSFSVRCHSD